ncbi:FMN-binding protein [Leifsonia sp. NPDC058248]|uniref:FMN-binding protein n=1 Tax=Leifsonia sp. NPDC058248 TaxID=3346402 RepID=UPI0036DB7034
MRRTKWRGTILFVLILTVMGLTAGLRLYGVGAEAAVPTAAASTATTPSSSATTTTAPAPTASAAAPSAAPTPTPSASAATAPKVVDGAVEDTPYGPIQVEVTFAGTKITAVKTVQTPSQEGRSVQINDYATPILAQEVLASQSAQIDTVSGATYTSDGYAQSVQSAIDQR